MSPEDRLQALEPTVTTMQSEVLFARATAAQAEQRATDAGTRTVTVRGDVVDTRLLGKLEERRRHIRHLETVQVHVPWPRWSC